MKRFALVLATVLIVIAAVSVSVWGIVYSLDQTKTGTITITSSGGGGNTPQQLKVYSDSGLTQEVQNLDIAYTTGNIGELTVYVSANAGTISTEITKPEGINITATAGTPADGAIPVQITISGGSEGSYGYSIRFTNS
jgi:hypothetical protein